MAVTLAPGIATGRAVNVPAFRGSMLADVPVGRHDGTCRGAVYAIGLTMPRRLGLPWWFDLRCRRCGSDAALPGHPADSGVVT